MGSLDKTIQKFIARSQVSYDEAERVLLFLGFEFQVTGSHHVFRKKGYPKNIALKRRSNLLPYQIKMVVEALRSYGYDEKK